MMNPGFLLINIKEHR